MLNDCIEKYILEHYGSSAKFVKATGMNRKKVALLLSDEEEKEEYNEALEEFLNVTGIDEDTLLSMNEEYRGKKIYPDVYDLIVKKLVRRKQISAKATTREKAIWYNIYYTSDKGYTIIEKYYLIERDYGTAEFYEDLSMSEAKEILKYASKLRKENIIDKAGLRARAEKGFCYSDAEDFTDWFLEVIPDMLQIIRDSGSHPCINEDGYLLAPLSLYGEDMAPYLERWQCILDQMIIFAHEAYPKTSSREDDVSDEAWIYFNQCLDDFFYLFRKYFWDLWI